MNKNTAKYSFIELEKKIQNLKADFSDANAHLLHDLISELENLKKVLDKPELPINNEPPEISVYQSILDSIPTAVVRLDVSGKIFYANQKAIEVLGLTKDDVNKRTYDDSKWKILSVDGTPFPQEKLPFLIVKKTLQSVHNIEHMIEKPDGEQVVLSIDAFPVFDKSDCLHSVTACLSDITLLKNSYSNSEKNAQKFKALFEDSPVGIFQTNSKGEVLNLNKKMANILGFQNTGAAIEHYENLGLELYVHSQRRDEFINLLKNNGSVENFVFEAKRVDGKHIWINMNARISKKNPDGSFIIEGFSSDITEQVEIEAQLRYNDHIFKNINDSIIATDFDRIINYWNTAAEKLYGWKKSEVMGKVIKNVIRVEMADSERDDLYDEVMRQGFWRGDAIHYHRDGSPIYVDWAISVLFDDNNKPIASIGISRDISEQKLAEERLRLDSETNLIFATLAKELITSKSIENISILVLEYAIKFTKSEFGYVGYIDQETGYLICPTMTRSIWDQCNVPDKSIVFKEFCGLWGWVLDNKKSLLTNHPDSDDRSTGVPIGHLPINRFLSVPVMKEDTLIGQIALANPKSDYTQRHLQLIERLANLYAIAIERKFNELIVEQSRKVAEENDRLKTSLLRNMSHEFRTPINGILGLTSVLIDMVKIPEQRELLRKVKKSTKRLLGTLTSIIDYSYLMATRNLDEYDFINMNDIIYQVSAEYKDIVIANKLQLEVDISTAPLFIRAPQTMLTQLLTHVIDNSIKFTEKGTISLLLRKIETEDNVYAELTVKDTGIGIAKEYQSVIFDAFRQASEGINRAYEGSGLGLSIVQRNIELLQGTITLESEINKGTKVIMRVPCNISIDSEPIETEKAKRSDTELDKQAVDKTLKVLVVEDNDVNVDVIRLNLEMRNYEIDEAENAMKAIKLAKKYSYDLVLMDINLGLGMNGIETARELRRINKNKSIPIIAVTGYAFDEDRRNLIRQGFNGYLAKPFAEEDLLNIIDKVLSEQNPI